MSVLPHPPLTQMLRQWSDGDPTLVDRVVPLLYEELKRLASRELRRERSTHTLQATALVSEAYLRLRQIHDVHWESRSQFLGFAAHLMRRILVDHARRKGFAKRGGGRRRVALDELDGVVGLAGLATSRPPDLVALDQALGALGEVDRRKAAVVELRFFGGLTVEETATVLGLSSETVGREWRRAKAWLYQELAGDGCGE
jgi:RNA polymerase sigma factor (TIGR02999 family)